MQDYCCEYAEECIVYDSEIDVYFLRIETSEWDYYYDGFTEELIPINYCPFCGQKLIK